MKKIAGIILLCSILLSSVSCDSTTQTLPETNASKAAVSDEAETENPDSATESETAKVELKDDIPEFDFEGYEYRILSREIATINYKMDAEEETGETLNDAIYRRNRKLEERFNFKFTETSNTDANYARKYIVSGDDAFDMINARCTAAISFFQEGLTYTVDKLSYVDLSKPWWDGELNQRITFAGTKYIALGAMNLSYYDFTHTLLFNKSMAESYNMEDIYSLVKDGKWTYEKFNSLASQTVVDVDGNGAFDAADQYGLLSAGKQVMPCMWIAADVLSVNKDASDIPYMSMGEEKFSSVFNEIFRITRDNGVWFNTQSDENIPPECIEIFKNDRGLFMDCTFYFITSMRDMETDFGIIPYPKWDESQSDYHSRVEFYDPTVVPVTNTNLERTGVIIEAMMCESYNSVIPAYYEVALKTKYSRDADSSAMLDLIFDTRVIDLGDTVYVDFIRDKVVKDMYKKDNRDLASKIASMETSVNSEIQKTLDALNNL